MNQRARSATLYELTYVTPNGAEKKLLWRGKSGRHAANSWLKIAAKGTRVIEFKEQVIKWME